MQEKRFEDTINELLTGDARKNALDFVAYLNANDITTRGSSICEGFSYRGRPVCVVFANGEKDMPGPWTIWHSGYDSNYPPDEIPEGEDGDKIGLSDLTADERLKEVAWEHVNTCASCGCDRKPGRRTTVFGKTFENVCTSTLVFTNPDAETLEYVKRLVDLMKRGIDSAAD